jgi:hypothetical protein
LWSAAARALPAELELALEMELDIHNVAGVVWCAVGEGVIGAE